MYNTRKVQLTSGWGRYRYCRQNTTGRNGPRYYSSSKIHQNGNISEKKLRSRPVL